MNRTAQLQLLAAAASLILWAIPGAGLALLPLEYLNTHIHELCHALVVEATGGTPIYIRVFANGSGVTPFAGGSPILAASAGYVGAAFVGGLIVLLARREKMARNLLLGVAVLLALSMALWVRGDSIGLISGALWIVLLYVAAIKLKGDRLVFVAQFIGIQQCLRSAQSLYVLLNINAFSGIENDAAVAEHVSGISRMVWALLWVGVSAAWMAVAFRPSFRPSRTPGRSTG